MVSDLDELYQEVILDHNQSPRNFRVQEPPALTRKGYNPLCGDRIQIYVRLEGDRIVDVSFQGNGCAISQASASVMTMILKGKSVAEAEALFEQFQAAVTGKAQPTETMGELVALAGVQTFPTRVKCATLAWHALRAALAGENEITSTEEI